MTNFDVHTLPEEEHQKYHRLIDKVNAAVTEVFGEEEQVVVVLGVQFGSMGRVPGVPVCLVSSNLPVCLIPEAITDMADFADAHHAAFHEQGGEGSTISQKMDLANVPQDILDRIKEKFPDVDLAGVTFLQVADISDLNSEPEIEEPERA